MSHSIAKFLTERKKPTLHKQPSGISFYSAVTAAEVKQQLDDIKQDFAIKSAITDRVDGQNALHILLGNHLYQALERDLLMMSESDAKRYVDMTKVNIPQAKNLFQSASAELKEATEAKETAERQENAGPKSRNSYHYYNWHPDKNNASSSYTYNSYYECSCASCSHSKNKVSNATKRYNAAKSAQEKAAHYTLALQEEKSRGEFEPNQLKAKNFRETQFIQMLEILLSPFDADEVRLIELITAKDKSNKTPLHYSLEKIESHLLAPLFTRIQKIKDAGKKALVAEMIDQDARNIWHIFLNSRTFRDVQAGLVDFSPEVVRNALPRRDRNGNTGLHEVLLPSSIQKLEKLKLLEPLLAPKKDAKDVKGETNNADVFVTNKANQNPLHLASEVTIKDEKHIRNAKDELEILKLIKEFCPKSQYVEKLKEQDVLGNPPLFSAIKNGPHEKVKLLLADLTQDEKDALAKIKNKKGETILHVAAEFADRPTIELLRDEISQTVLFEIRRTSEDDFVKQLKQNTKMSANDFKDVFKQNILFDIYQYLIKKYGRGWMVTENHKLRVKDFYECLLARSKNEKLPDANLKLLSGSTHEYHDKRELLSMVDPEKAKQFLRFLGDKTKGNPPCPIACEIFGIDPKKSVLTSTKSTLYYGEPNSTETEFVMVMVTGDLQKEGSAPALNG